MDDNMSSVAPMEASVPVDDSNVDTEPAVVTSRIGTNKLKFNTSPLMQLSKAALIALIKDIVETSENGGEGSANPRSVVERHVSNSQPKKSDATVSAEIDKEDVAMINEESGEPKKKLTKAEKRASKEKEFSLAKYVSLPCRNDHTLITVP
jgi:hypothetical protein